MPLIFSEKDSKFGKTFLWSVTEEASFFSRHLERQFLVMDHIRGWHPGRQLEWLSGRFLVSQYIDHPVSDLKTDPYGKPCMTGSDLNISISHTDGLVGLMVHNDPIGLDLQIKTDKISRVAHKFCTHMDYQLLADHYAREDAERVIWSYKEAVFKAYGKGRISYKDHIILRKVTQTKSSKSLQISMEKDGIAKRYVGKIRFIGPYCFSQVREVESGDN